MKYKLALHIPGAIFYLDIEVDPTTDIEYVAEHISKSMNASLLYKEQIEEQP